MSNKEKQDTKPVDPAMERAMLQEASNAVQENQQSEKSTQADEGATPEKEGKKKTDRINDIYGQMKGYERQLEATRKQNEDLQATIKDMADHNKKLAESIGRVEDQFAESSKPNREDDPEAYDNWLIQKTIRETQKAMMPQAQEADPQAQAQPGQMTPLQIQALTMSSIYPDYHQAEAEVAEIMKNDDALRVKIMSSENPPQAAYNFWKQMKQSDKTSQDQIAGQSYVESGTMETNPPAAPKLTETQKRLAAALGVSEEKYLAQQKHINSRRVA